MLSGDRRLLLRYKKLLLRYKKLMTVDLILMNAMKMRVTRYQSSRTKKHLEVALKNKIQMLRSQYQELIILTMASWYKTKMNSSIHSTKMMMLKALVKNQSSRTK
jgi:ferredoxin-like protein FixX